MKDNKCCGCTTNEVEPVRLAEGKVLCSQCDDSLAKLMREDIYVREPVPVLVRVKKPNAP